MQIAVRFLAYVMLVFAGAGTLTAVFSAFDDYDEFTLFWLLYSALLAFFAVAFLFTSATETKATERQQALYTCALLAGAVPVFVAMPFYVQGSGAPASWFEAISGLTTSGSSALARPSLLPDALVIWRVLIEWIGGWVFLVFAIALQPILNIAGMAYAVNYLPHGEAAGYHARTISISLRIARLYIAITGLAVLFFMLIGLPTRLALPLSMMGLATGGYLPIEQGVSAFAQGFSQLGLIFFLFLGCLNFTLHYAAVRGHISVYWRDTETRALLRLIALGILAIFTVSVFSGALQSDDINLSDIVFMTMSAVSTTGITPLGTQTAPLSIGILLLCLCVAGGMAGSTTGGIKILRALLIDRFVNAELTKVSNPHRVNPVSFEGRIIKVSDMMGVWALVLVIATTIALGSLVLSALQMPFLTAISVSVSAVTNTGPLPDMIDARFAGYEALSPGMLTTCAGLMLLGKMEFLILLSLVFSGFLKR